METTDPQEHRFSDEQSRKRRRVAAGAGIVLLIAIAGGIGYALGARADWRGAMHVASAAAEEAAITARVETAFAWSQEISADAIDLAFQGAVVRFRGTAPSEELRRIAMEIAEKTVGVDRVEHQLVVDHVDQQETTLNKEPNKERSNQ